MSLLDAIKAKKEQLRAKVVQQATADIDELKRVREERKQLQDAIATREELRTEKKALRGERFKANNPLISRAVENMKKRTGEAKAKGNGLFSNTNYGGNGNPFGGGSSTPFSGGFNGIPGVTTPAKATPPRIKKKSGQTVIIIKK